ncbi:MAG: hypothetical protein ACM3JK_02925 [Betaproteobacteria bacterium]
MSMDNSPGSRSEVRERSHAPQGNSDFLRSEACERSYVASAGWEHPEWNGGFYPDDLPPEWRLAYYAHIYPGVYLSRAAWSDCDLQTLSGWVDDTPAHFRFVLEANPGGNDDADRARLQVLAPRIGLVLESPGRQDGRVLWLEGEPDLKKLAKSLQELAASPGPIYLVSLDANLETMNRAAILLEVMGL